MLEYIGNDVYCYIVVLRDSREVPKDNIYVTTTRFDTLMLKNLNLPLLRQNQEPSCQTANPEIGWRSTESV